MKYNIEYRKTIGNV